MTSASASDFELWWRLEGQFIPPLDSLKSGFVLDHYKAFAFEVWSRRDSDVEEAYQTGMVEGIMNAEP